MNNLFVSYDLHQPGQRYAEVIAEIKKHGQWAKVHYSLFYLKTQESAEQVARAVWAKMDGNDKLLVVNATSDTAYWYNLGTEVSDFLQEHWHKRA
jgi:hypothetical protein